ncbi:MAG: prepilin-type N-terminal cleavage/methylation domain-containing protein [Methylophilus sp.]|nr:prepilin-type N-terminal cleavage/methylation domain-containing protein [Methylophilus sp.]
MMKQKSIIKQKGFTLLELLVVITLLAILAVGGLVAYDGVTDNAEASAAAYNAGTLDRAVRQYRAVTSNYPDQWDNLADPTTGLPVGSADASSAQSTDNDQFLAVPTRAVFGAWNVAASASAVQDTFFEVVDEVWGMEELQHVEIANFDPSVAPGKMHNEGSLTGTETDFAAGAFNFISIVPSYAADGDACTMGGQAINSTFDGTSSSSLGLRMNAMNDAMGAERCHLVIALGFGGDAASSTSRASVQIPAAPTFTSEEVNPAQNYGRYIGLFHVARNGSGDGAALDETHFFPRPKLIGFVDTAGNPVDVNIAASRDPSDD